MIIAIGGNMHKKRLIIIYIIAFVVLYVMIYILPDVLGTLKSSYAVQYGELSVKEDAVGVIVRDENVYTSATSGRANYLIRENDLVRVGTKVIDITGEKHESDEGLLELGKKVKNVAVNTGDYTSQADGLVAYNCDGYEGKFRLDKISSITENKINNIKAEEVVNLKRQMIGNKEPIFKVVDRSKWNIVCFLSDKSHIKYKEGDGIKVGIENAGEKASVIMSIESVTKKKGKIKLVLESDRFYKGLTRDRKVNLKLVDSVNRGLIVRNSSLTKDKKGVQGVMVKDKVGNFVFKPVQVIATDGENSVVTSNVFYDKSGKAVDTIVTYDQVLTRP